MAKVQKIAEITPNIPFSEFNFYDLYRSTFEKSELGRIKRLLPLKEMAENFGLIRKSMKPKLRRKSHFTPEGKVALMATRTATGGNLSSRYLEKPGDFVYICGQLLTQVPLSLKPCET